MASIWESFGLRGNPYQSTPLLPTKEDAEIFVGREDLGTRFQTQIDCDNGCVAVLSGDVGVGKTSFFNIQQYLLYTQSGAFGPKLIPAFELTPLTDEDTSLTLARRIVHNAVRSVERLCELNRKRVPRQVKRIGSWLSHKGSASGFDFGFSVLGNGGNFAISFEAPPVADASLENWREVLSVIASEARQTLGYRGVFCALDNAENVDDEKLAQLLMAFRDTLFTTEGVWWVIIGQSGLYSLIDAADRRVSQRIQGAGIEVPPLSAGELHDLVEARVRRYRSQRDAVSPISSALHTMLFEASRGEIRFVLNTSDALLREVVTDIRDRAMEKVREHSPLYQNVIAREVDRALGEILINRQLPDSVTKKKLKEMTNKYLTELQLKKTELRVLSEIGKTEARASDYAKYKVRSMQDFSSNYLMKMFSQNLLHRRQAGRAVHYSLRGHAALAYEFGLFDQLVNS